MKILSSERQEHIDALVAETAMGGITAGLPEKDEHLTDALRALFELPLDGMSLVFCGGTSLSKAHGLIEHMPAQRQRDFSQDELDGSAAEMNNRPRAAHD